MVGKQPTILLWTGFGLLLTMLICGLLLRCSPTKSIPVVQNPDAAAWDRVQRFADAQSRLHVANTKAAMQILSSAIHLFSLKHGRYPATLRELIEKPESVDQKDWPAGGYFSEMLKDGWSRDFVYRRPGKGGRAFDLISLGMDGREGGEVFDADLIHEESANQEKPK